MHLDLGRMAFWTVDSTGRILAGPFPTHAAAETHREQDRRPSEIIGLATPKQPETESQKIERDTARLRCQTAICPECHHPAALVGTADCRTHKRLTAP